MKRRQWGLVIGFGMILAGARATDYYVAPDGDDIHDGTSWANAWKTISNGVAKIPAGNTLVLSNGLYELDKQVSLTKAITVTNATGDPDGVVVSGKGTVRCFYLGHAEAVLSGVTVSNGLAVGATPNATYGGGAHVVAGCINQCVFRNNIASPENVSGLGGGVSLFDGGRLYNSRLENNLAGGTGGAGGRGGGVNVNSNSVVSNCVVMGNTARYKGGGIHMGGVYGIEGTGLVTHCQVLSNQSLNVGGGICAVGGQILNSTCQWNSAATEGGGVYVYPAVISNCVIASNIAPGSSMGGGIIMNVAQCFLYDSTVAGNSASNGAGVYARPNAPSLIERCEVRQNVAISGGGGINYYNDAGTLTVLDSTIRDNTAGTGGGMYTVGYAYSLSMQGCLIANNSAASAGGFYSSGTNFLLSHCRLTGNTATTYGGAMRLVITWPVNGGIRNCLIYGNRSESQGGAAYLTCGQFDSCTIVSNTAAGQCGGVYMDGSSRTIELNNCIVYGNTGSAFQNYRSPTSGQVYFNYSCTTPTTPSSILLFTECTGADPLLAYDPAGPAARLRAGSPCINTGTNQGWMADALDLDGRRRQDPFTRQVDMGAYEFLPQGTLFHLK